MLGEHIGSEHGHTTARRVIPVEDNHYVKLEVSFETECELLGVQGQNIGTFTLFSRGTGQLYAEGSGIFLSANGDSAIWNGHGVGQPASEGDIMVAGSVAFQTTSESLKKLNDTLIVLEHHSHADGHLHSDLWTWSTPAH